MIYLNDPLQDKKAAQEKERESRIAEAAVQNLQGERHQEGLILAQKLAQQQLQIKEISSDGHCMYRAIEDQMVRRSEVNIVLEYINIFWCEYPIIKEKCTGNGLK